MADLIDRKAVLDYLDIRNHDAEERDWRSGANEISRIRAAIAALPAQGVRVKPLTESEKGAANLMACALWSELHEKAGEGVLPEKLPKAAADVLRDLMREKLAYSLAAPAPAEAGRVEEPVSDARIECEALCARFLAGEASEKEVVDTIRRIARANERLAVLAGKHKEQMRLETDMEHIARDMREGRFPERSEPQIVPVTPAPVDALVKAAREGALREAADLANTTFHGSGTEAAAIIRMSILALIGEKP